MALRTIAGRRWPNLRSVLIASVGRCVLQKAHLRYPASLDPLLPNPTVSVRQFGVAIAAVIGQVISIFTSKSAYAGLGARPRIARQRRGRGAGADPEEKRDGRAGRTCRCIPSSSCSPLAATAAGVISSQRGG